MSGHVIDRLTLKIHKNVNKTEIDHIGAYLCGHKLSELLLCHYNDKIDRENCENLCVKICCHFNEIGHFNENFDEDDINIFYFVCSSFVVHRLSPICSSARHFRSRRFDRPPWLIWSLLSSMLHFNQAKLFKFKFQHLYILQCLSSKMLLLSRTIIELSFSVTVCVIQTTKRYSIQCCLSYFNSLTSWRC